MTLSLEYAALSDVGRVRRNNEDSAYAGPNLLLLADGMGGAAAGEVASSAAVQVIRKLDRPDRVDMIEALAGAVHRANERLAELVEEDPEREGMGSTVTALMFDGERLALAHLGDSRAYRMRDGQLTQLSHDHTFVQSLVDEGRIGADEAFSHPHRNLILRVLDGRADSDPDLEILDIAAGDRLMLCSDGLPDYVRDADIATAMSDGTPDSVVVDLVTRALEANSNDNVTCVVADVVQVDQPAAQPGPPGQPQLVGAAAELAQGGAGRPEPTIEVRRGPADGDDIALGMGIDEHDLEALRYAPQAPKRFGWARRIAVMVVILALVGGAGWIAYTWTQRQYYVGSSGDNVAIFKGVDADLPGIELSTVFEVQTLQIDQLPTYRRNEVEATMPATSLADAHAIVTRLQTEAVECARQNTPTPKPSTPVKPTTPGNPPSGRPTQPTQPPQTTPTSAPTSTTTPGLPGDGCG